VQGNGDDVYIKDLLNGSGDICPTISAATGIGFQVSCTQLSGTLSAIIGAMVRYNLLLV